MVLSDIQKLMRKKKNDVNKSLFLLVLFAATSCFCVFYIDKASIIKPK